MRTAYAKGAEYNGAEILFNLSSAYPDLNLQWDDLVIIDGEWTIDSMDPYEWCEAQMMD